MGIFDFLKNNEFEKPKPTLEDMALFGVLTVILTLFIIGYLTQSTVQNFGTIYFYLTVITFIFLIVAIVTRFKVFSFVFYGKGNTEKKFFKDVVIGLVAALAFIALFSQIGFSVAIPLSINQVNTSSVIGIFLTLTILCFYGPLSEEIFWIGSFVPSFLLFIKNNLGYILVAFGVLLPLLVLLLGSYYFGSIGIFIAIVIWIISIILEIKIVYKPLSRIRVNKIFPGVIMGVILILSLHIYSYGSLIANWKVFAVAGLFFLVEGVIDVIRNSIIPSIIMHTTNNAIAAISLAGIGSLLGIPLSLFFIPIMILFLWSILRARKPYIMFGSTSPGKFILSEGATR